MQYPRLTTVSSLGKSTLTIHPFTAMRNPDRKTVFHFKEFDVSNCRSAMKVGTDGVLLGAWALDGYHADAARVLDVGTGTGVIALMAAQALPTAEITAVEIDDEAAAEAAENFTRSPWSGRLQLVNADFRAPEVTEHGKFDLIISNPPFFTNGAEAPDARRRDARHAAALSPLSLVTAAPGLLVAGGSLCMISMPDSRRYIETEATLAGLAIERVTEVSTVTGRAPRRMLWRLRRHSGFPGTPTVSDTLAIRGTDNLPTPAYIKLVSPYYITVK